MIITRDIGILLAAAALTYRWQNKTSESLLFIHNNKSNAEYAGNKQKLTKNKLINEVYQQKQSLNFYHSLAENATSASSSTTRLKENRRCTIL